MVVTWSLHILIWLLLLVIGRYLLVTTRYSWLLMVTTGSRYLTPKYYSGSPFKLLDTDTGLESVSTA